MSHPPCAEIPPCAADPLCRCFLSLLLLFSLSTLGSLPLRLWPDSINSVFFKKKKKGTQVVLTKNVVIYFSVSQICIPQHGCDISYPLQTGTGSHCPNTGWWFPQI